MNSEFTLLKTLFEKAVEAVHPRSCLPALLPADRTRPALVLGAGKAAAAMAKVFEDNWTGPLRGLVVTRYGHSESCRTIQVLEAGHPLPDSAGQTAAEQMLRLLASKNRDDHEAIFFLVSGGGSALLTAPAPPVTLRAKQAINAALLRSGANIGDINCVRKHLSALKGGRLAELCEPATVTTFAISDVPGNDPTVIASGPTVADPTTSAQALAILDAHGIAISQELRTWLRDPVSETPKPGELSHHPFHMIATPLRALQAAAEYARLHAITPLILGDQIQGEAREVAKVMAGIAMSVRDSEVPCRRPCVILSSGETTVTMRGKGRGGRNTEFLLSLALALKGRPGIFALAADTDGIDGSEDNAGAFLSPSTLARAEKLGLYAHELLANNDSYGFFSGLGDLLVTGPTRTNVNDFRAILVM